MVKVYRGELSIEDLAAAGKITTIRTAVTPWSMDGVGLKRYVGSAVWWKGRKVPGAAAMTEDEIKAALAAPKGMAAGVKKIASTAKRVTDVFGAALGSIAGTKTVRGRTVAYSKRGLVPARCLRIAEAHGKKVTIERSDASVREIIRPIVYPEVIVTISI